MRQFLKLMVLCSVVAGCTMQPDKYAGTLAVTDAKWDSVECKEIRVAALSYDDKVGGRMAIGLASGLLLGPFGLPLAIAADANQGEKRKAFTREVHLRCSSLPLPKSLGEEAFEGRQGGIALLNPFRRAAKWLSSFDEGDMASPPYPLPRDITGKSIHLAAFGSALDGVTNDTTNAERAAEAAIALGVPLELTGETLKLSSNRSVLALADRIGWGWVKVGGITVPWNRDVRNNPTRFETAGAPSTLREAVADDNYRAFPVSTRIKNGAIITQYWRGNGHSPNFAGDGLGDIECILSFDGGASVTVPFSIAGNIAGLDGVFAYYIAIGTDENGHAVAVMGLNEGPYVVPYITRSKDGLIWSPPVKPLLVNDKEVIKPATLIPFGTIASTPSGRLLIPFYQTTRNWIAVIDPDSPNTLDFASLVVNASDPDYTEQAVTAVSELEWYVVSRRTGVASPALFRTLDGGGSWVYLGQVGTSGIDAGGGYVPQGLLTFVTAGETHLGMITGMRKSTSGPLADAPALMLAASRVSELTPSNLAFRKIHVWPMADDGHDRDAYAGFTYDPVTRSLFVSTHEETEEDKSRILIGAVNIGDAMHGRAVHSTGRP